MGYIMTSSLTQTVLKYQKTGDGLDTIVNRISILAYEYPKRFRGMSRESCSDFYCSFHPKIIPMVDRFEYQEKPFEMYLYASMKWHLKGFIRRQKKKETVERVFMQPTFWDESLSVRESSEPILPQCLTNHARRVLEVDSNGRIVEPSIRKRVMCLLLKGGDGLSATKLEAVARLIECDLEWVHESLGTLRESRNQHYRRRRLLEIRRNTHYLKINCLQEQWDLAEYPEERQRITEEIDLERAILSKLNFLISRTRLTPTHQAISEITGIPKGTIDSGLYTIRRELQETSQAEDPPVRRPANAS
jgi:hypothetical protein